MPDPTATELIALISGETEVDGNTKARVAAALTAVLSEASALGPPVGYQPGMYVSLDGSDETGDGTITKPYATPQKALDMNATCLILSPGDYSGASLVVPATCTTLSVFGLGGSALTTLCDSLILSAVTDPFTLLSDRSILLGDILWQTEGSPSQGVAGASSPSISLQGCRVGTITLAGQAGGGAASETPAGAGGSVGDLSLTDCVTGAIGATGGTGGASYDMEEGGYDGATGGSIGSVTILDSATGSITLSGGEGGQGGTYIAGGAGGACSLCNVTQSRTGSVVLSGGSGGTGSTPGSPGSQGAVTAILTNVGGDITLSGEAGDGQMSGTLSLISGSINAFTASYLSCMVNGTFYYTA